LVLDIVYEKDQTVTILNCMQKYLILQRLWDHIADFNCSILYTNQQQKYAFFFLQKIKP
jgi:hypothetical protein